MQFNTNRKTPLTEGGEGIIYQAKQGYVVKIFKPKINLVSKRKKIETLINIHLPKEVIKPEEIVTDKNGNFIGMSMPEIQGEDFKKLSNRKFVKSNNINTKDVLEMLSRLWEILQKLHSKNIFIGDLNDQNILLNPKTKEIYIIDTDSWSIGNEHCLVAMDLFKDPKLVADNFNADTDTYAFCILAWKSLTRIHPYGGTTNPDMNQIERMKQGISVIDNPKVIIPKMAKSWRNLSPDLIAAFKKVFNNGDRKFGNYIEDMLNHLSYCKTDDDYYFDGFSSCPFCNNSAVIVQKAVSIGVENGFKIAKIFVSDDVKAVYSETIYLNKKDEIVDLASGNKVPFNGGRCIFDKNNHIIMCYKNNMEISLSKSSESTYIPIKFNSYPLLVNNELYYISDNDYLCKGKIIGNGFGGTKIQKCSNNAFFNVENDKYCIVNIYDGKIIVNIDGFFYEMNFDKKIISGDCHYDIYYDRWLIVLEDSTSTYHSYVIEKNNLIWNSNRIDYKCSVYNICFNGGAIYIPIDNAIRGLNYKTLNYKDFKCSVVTSDSILKKSGKQFIIINDDNAYRFYK